ncbi:hypothetical protein DPF_2280 [Desulfoplanes formicivorans]|uniref:Uncharacterized protein n=1 Tax=Desulfoplanes formicivorans TaxID=1592317 RepID=A0A194AHI9_9BACT|nr:hypothetical protein DPF_2280 [Desulfoplanes formicivorans]
MAEVQGPWIVWFACLDQPGLPGVDGRPVLREHGALGRMGHKEIPNTLLGIRRKEIGPRGELGVHGMS